MKVHHDNYIKHSRKIIFFIAILISTMFLLSCTKKPNSYKVICNQEDHSLYSEVMEEILPSYRVEQSENIPYYNLDDGSIVEAFDTQALGAIETGIAKYWYPHYLATVIIALDRDQTDALVSGWDDLFESQEEIAFHNTPGNVEMFTGAMSYGLEGENYSLKKVIQLLNSLYDNNRLIINSFQAPIIICYDYQAANLIENGRNIEIIIPQEGTFTYEKGLLANESLNFQVNVDKLLLKSNLPLLDGKRKSSLYPDIAAYERAVRVKDYKHFAKTSQKASALIERKVLNSRKYMSIDGREHIYFALVYIIFFTIWIGSVLRRSMQKGVSYAAFFTGIILIGWTLVRLVKYQVELNPLLTRYLWYSFYIFQLTLPLVLLWMAWAIDKPEDETFPPKWWQNMLILISLLIVLVFTNDLHGFVFHLDLNRPDWAINYSYGFGYYTILFVCMMNLLVVLIMLIIKSIKNPRKKGIVLPPLIFIMFALYNYKYIVRDPFVYATDITIITGLFTMLMFEACIQTGLIPVNTKYIDLFTRSPLKIQIINEKGERVLASTSARPLDKDIMEEVVDSSSLGTIQEEDLMLYAKPIPGGYAIWHEDISKLSQLYRKIQKSTQMLTEANAILMEEEKLKRSINEKNAKKELMGQLEIEIAEMLEELRRMIEKLPYSEEETKDSTRIALLLCYIKRRCNLFFREKESNNTGVDELILCIDELIEIAKHSNVQIASVNKIKGNIDIRYGTLFYDFFYRVVDLAVKLACPYIVQHFESSEESYIMRFLPSEDMGRFKTEAKFLAAITAAKGKIVIKELEDTIGINISFPKGGASYD